MFVVVVVWFCFSSWLAVLILTYYSNLMHQFLLHWVICFGGYLIVHTEFFEKDGLFLWFAKNNFWVFLSVPHLVDNYAKIVDGRGRNLMCHRTLPSRLVLFRFESLLFSSRCHRWLGDCLDHACFRPFWINIIFSLNSPHLIWCKFLQIQYAFA